MFDTQNKGLFTFYREQQQFEATDDNSKKQSRNNQKKLIFKKQQNKQQNQISNELKPQPWQTKQSYEHFASYRYKQLYQKPLKLKKNLPMIDDHTIALKNNHYQYQNLKKSFKPIIQEQLHRQVYYNRSEQFHYKNINQPFKKLALEPRQFESSLISFQMIDNNKLERQKSPLKSYKYQKNRKNKDSLKDLKDLKDFNEVMEIIKLKQKQMLPIQHQKSHRKQVSSIIRQIPSLKKSKSKKKQQRPLKTKFIGIIDMSLKEKESSQKILPIKKSNLRKIQKEQKYKQLTDLKRPIFESVYELMQRSPEQFIRVRKSTHQNPPYAKVKGVLTIGSGQVSDNNREVVIKNIVEQLKFPKSKSPQC